MKDDTLAKKQHYVPRVYLSGFSNDSKTMYAFRLDKEDVNRVVSIKSVCTQDYLYEIINQDGDFIAPNHVEKVLGDYERMFSYFLRKLNKKVSNDENYLTRCFLSTEEKAFWFVYISLQILRTPKIIHVAETTTADYLKGSSDASIAKALALYQCLPIYRELRAEEHIVFNLILSHICDMHINVGVDASDSIFTSDDPVYLYWPGYPNGECEHIIFPLTSKLVLMLYGSKMKKAMGRTWRNRVRLLTEEDKVSVKKSIAYTTNQWIYSKNPLSPSDISCIQEARFDKKRDEQLTEDAIE